MFKLTRDVSVTPGQLIDLGTRDVTTAKRVDAPAVKAAPAAVPINGRIVDREGQPVAGVAVKASR